MPGCLSELCFQFLISAHVIISQLVGSDPESGSCANRADPVWDSPGTDSEMSFR